MDVVVCRRARPLLGTLVDVQAEGPDVDAADAAVAAAFDEIAAVHALLSFHAHDSELQSVNRALPAARLQVDPRTLVVLRLAAALFEASARAFDCRVGAQVDARFPVAFDGDVVVKQTDASMDLGGIAKGYAVDCAIDVLRGFAIERAVVNAGGDLRHYGVRPMTAQVRDPRNAARVATTVLLDNAALASSTVGGLGAHANSASRIHNAERAHLPALAGATVQAPTCMLADALTKVVLATGDVVHPLLAQYGATVALYSPT